MKILAFSWRDPKHPLAGGAEQVVHEHMKGWIEKGHEVTLFSSKIKDQPREETLNSIKIVRGGYEYLGVQVAAFFYWLKNKKNFDLVVDQFHGIPFFTPLYIRKPKLAILQEVAREVWLKNPLLWPLNWLVGLIGYWGEFVVFQFYKKTPFMVGSQSAKDDLRKMGIAKKLITIVPHGVLIDKPEVMPKKDKKPTVIYLGALTKDKGVEDALKTFSVLSGISNYQFWVVGGAETKEYEMRIKVMTKKMGIADDIIFWGGRDKVDNNKKFELLARAHVMVNPSVREGWGLVNIEANAMATPVVAYNSPGLVDSVIDGKTGVICKQNSPETMAKEVFDLLEEKKRLDRLSRQAVKWAKSFSWNESKKKSLLLLDKVLGGQV